MDETQARIKAQARLDVIEIGRLAGSLEAKSRREDGDAAAARIKRAMAYAAWDFDERPEGTAHLVEFGITASTVTPSLERAPLQSGAVQKEEPDSSKFPKRKIGGRRT